LVAAVVITVLGVNVPPAWAMISNFLREREINSQDYKAAYGHWDVVDLPVDGDINAVHAALLHTGKLLIVAGSGNDEKLFDAGSFTTVIYDPLTSTAKQVPTPADLFCGGHAFLADGNLLIAGGTGRYEVLKQDVRNASGTLVVKNESPAGTHREFPKDTVFTDDTGHRYRSTAPFTLHPAAKRMENGKAIITPSAEKVFVVAEREGNDSTTGEARKYAIDGLAELGVYAQGGPMTMDKQEYQGIKDSYEFDPVAEQYVRVGDLNEKRWYPTLTGLPNGTVLAVSGLDGSGKTLDGHNELYDPVAKTWTPRPDLRQYFPSYPAIFQTAMTDRLFYSGSNSGYSRAGRSSSPGFWNLQGNQFQPVPGLRDPDLLETSSSAWIGPVQDQRMMIVGGGGIGDSGRSTGRVDLIDLDDPSPTYRPGPDLPEGTRYPNLVTLPDDTTLITGGASDYRGRGASTNHTARIFHPDTNRLALAADPLVGRNYHSAAVLLPDGRVITMGSNPLYSDQKNTITAPFEQRLEIFTPPYLFRGPRPTLTDGPAAVARGQAAAFATPDAARITTARLIKPSAVTHVTNLEQRSIALEMVRAADSVTVTVPDLPTLVPPGDYLLFVSDDTGVPSVGRWVRVP
jgi:hypothetical protein